jgi:hypothetical protein
MLAAMRRCDFVVTITVVRSVTHLVMDISLPALARAGRAISGPGRDRYQRHCNSCIRRRNCSTASALAGNPIETRPSPYSLPNQTSHASLREKCGNIPILKEVAPSSDCIVPPRRTSMRFSGLMIRDTKGSTREAPTVDAMGAKALACF